ncbi:hypothetical protein CB1_001616023 [Camelus ferus]|nr:hypothetical protein CB1_001616023 [Camelus ferus]
MRVRSTAQIASPLASLKGIPRPTIFNFELTVNFSGPRKICLFFPFPDLSKCHPPSPEVQGRDLGRVDARTACSGHRLTLFGHSDALFAGSLGACDFRRYVTTLKLSFHTCEAGSSFTHGALEKQRREVPTVCVHLGEPRPRRRNAQREGGAQPGGSLQTETCGDQLRPTRLRLPSYLLGDTV